MNQTPSSEMSVPSKLLSGGLCYAINIEFIAPCQHGLNIFSKFKLGLVASWTDNKSRAEYGKC